MYAGAIQGVLKQRRQSANQPRLHEGYPIQDYHDLTHEDYEHFTKEFTSLKDILYYKIKKQGVYPTPPDDSYTQRLEEQLKGQFESIQESQNRLQSKFLSDIVPKPKKSKTLLHQNDEEDFDDIEELDYDQEEIEPPMVKTHDEILEEARRLAQDKFKPKIYYNYEVHGKKLRIAFNALNILSLNNRFRQAVIWIVEWKYFDRLIIFLIILNSVFLGMMDYTDPNSKAIGNQLVDNSELAFTIFFTLESALKIIGMGFLLESGSYLRDAWNWLDFCVVVTALLQVIPGMNNVSGLRTFRLFRPLRSLSSMPSMKILVSTLLSSVGQLGNILALAMFFFGIFAILGISLWSGIFHQRCRQTPTPVDGDWLTVPGDDKVCGSFHQCEFACGSLFTAYDEDPNNLPTFTEEMLYRDTEIDNLNFGITGFDNIGQAFLTIFQCITLEGWVNIMYHVQDSYNIFLSAIYFCLCVIICSYFLLNLTVAVMLDNFQELHKGESAFKKFFESLYGTKDIDVEAKKKEIQNRQLKSLIDKPPPPKQFGEKMKDLYAAAIYRPLIINEGYYCEDEEGNILFGKKNYHRFKLTRFCYTIIMYPWFQTLIMISIVANTVTLSLDRYQIPIEEEEVLSVFNVVFTVIFTIESILKIIGLGMREFVRDTFNIFDAVVVGISLVELVIGGSGSVVSALRAFRLFRIVKLARSWESLKILLDSIAHTIAAIGNFSVLLFLFIYVYSLLGMQFFAGKMKFDDNGNFDPENGELPRQNFDSLIWALLTVFGALVGENWNDVMYLCMRSSGWHVSLYFISLIIFGNIIMLNLFLAILLGNFDEASVLMKEKKFFENEKKKEKERSILLKKSTQLMIGELAEEAGKGQRLVKDMNDTSEIKEDMKPGEGDDQDFLQENLDQLEEGASGKRKSVKFREDLVQNDNSSNNSDNMKSSRPIVPRLKLEKKSPSFKQKKKDEVHLFEYDSYYEMSETEEDESATKDNMPGEEVKEESLKGKIQLNSTEDNVDTNMDMINGEEESHAYKFNQEKGRRTNFEGSKLKGDLFNENNDYNEQFDSMKGLNKSDSINQRSLNISTTNLTSVDVKKRKRICNYMLNSSCLIFHKEHRCRRAFLKLTVAPPPKPKRTTGNLGQSVFEKSDPGDFFDNDEAPSNQSSKRNTATNANNKSYETLEQKIAAQVKQLQQKRKKCSCPMPHQLFENTILVLIIVSSLMLVIDNPLNDPNSILSLILFYVDTIFTCLFTIEAVIKIVSFGMLSCSIKGQKAYLAIGWNILDFFVVLASLADLLFGSAGGSALKSLKALRALRALRPLRVISRNEGLKLVVNSLFSSMPALGNVMLVCGLFVLIFSILGVNFFKGAYFSCNNLHDLSLDLVNTSQDCLDLGGQWLNAISNFDTVINATLTLFEMMTTEGWLTVMYNGIDARGIGYQPRRESQVPWLSYFVLFIIVGHMFIFNLFVGVVIENFNRMKDKLCGYILMTDEQRSWVEMQRYMIRQKLQPKQELPKQKFRLQAYNFVNATAFDLFITSCILLNTVVMAMRFYRMPIEYEEQLENANIVFAMIFNFECVAKLIALGKYYFWSLWNKFDFIIVVGTDAGLIFKLMDTGIDLGTAASVVRAFRIMRIFRLIKSSKNLRVLLDTLVYILPSLANIGSLIFLMFFIFAALGINLFSGVMFQSELNSNVNFTHFGWAFLVLMRCATGENWNLLMSELANNQGFEGEPCVEDQSYEEVQRDGIKGCGSFLSYPYFLTFMITISMMIMNLFVAVVIEGFSASTKENTGVVTSQDYTMMIDKWAVYDPKASGFIKPVDLAFLIYELPPPLGRQGEIENSINQINESQKRAGGILEIKKKFITHPEKKDMIIPQSAVLNLLKELQLPIYENQKVHFKDICIKLTQEAIKLYQGGKDDFAKIGDDQDNRLAREWKKKHNQLKTVTYIKDLDTGLHWAGQFIMKLMKAVRERKNQQMAASAKANYGKLSGSTDGLQQNEVRKENDENEEDKHNNDYSHDNKDSIDRQIGEFKGKEKPSILMDDSQQQNDKNEFLARESQIAPVIQTATDDDKKTPYQDKLLRISQLNEPMKEYIEDLVEEEKRLNQNFSDQDQKEKNDFDRFTWFKDDENQTMVKWAERDKRRSELKKVRGEEVRKEGEAPVKYLHSKSLKKRSFLVPLEVYEDMQRKQGEEEGIEEESKGVQEKELPQNE